ncbi:IS1595 family transposase [Paracraurococcus lichenis]|uniref:IS1595 family transposase n=1 Tax=Paracraurococcus lichenis TaxID=3064888 RepID=A0ABT9E911_9PROT|nr:IS1595 family transposase [Paracraurococcus sp. LOR1-02]MDO9712589.1 IS1595 family transposase [Paracraurococcus sp. LOR1-02]
MPLSYMTDHRSVRKIVEAGIGVNHTTVWRWRHRFLKAAAQDNTATLSGVIEADETFFVRSCKGHRGWVKGRPPEPRAARPRAWGTTKRGLSDEQVPVLTALDNAGGVYEAILPSLTAIETTLDGRIAPGSVVCSDGTAAYVKAAVKAGAEHRRVVVPTTTPVTVKVAPLPTKRRQKGRLGLGRVNAHHGQIKALVNGRCRGVATRYLGNYLGWHRAMLHEGFTGKALLDRALA